MVKKRMVAFASAMICVVGLFFVTVALTGSKADASAPKGKMVNAGSTWVVEQTTRLNRLTVQNDADIKAPEGHSLTMTVDGVGTRIEPGVYSGDIVLTVTDEIKVQYGMLPYPHYFRTAVYIEDGKYIPEKSVAAAVVGGEVTDAIAKDIRITSEEENFNGIIVTGDKKASYSIINPVINFNGNGENDFAGFGAAVMSSGNSEVTLENARIVTHGVVRTAVFVNGNSTMRVNDSYIEVNDGIMPADYEFSVQAGKMKEVPWMLGLTGNVRATNVLENGTAYYTNTHFKAQRWGALSTDGTTKIRLYATNCLIETVESGYGAYSILDCHDYFSGCTFNVTDYGLIVAMQGSATFTDETVVNSGRFGVMMHSGSGGGMLTIEKGSVFNTGSTAIQVKGRGANILVDNAQLNAENGIILQQMENDDPNKAGGRDRAHEGEEAGRGGGQGGPPPGGGQGAPPSGGGPGGGETFSTNVVATFRNVTLKGDVINSMTARGDMMVTFQDAAITGAITTAACRSRADVDGRKLSRETCHYIGDVVNTYCATDDAYGMKVSLENASWIVDETSYLNELSISSDATVSAPGGFGVKMTVDGIDTPIKPGKYEGKIVLAVSRNA
jgi:hypothetical protein